MKKKLNFFSVGHLVSFNMPICIVKLHTDDIICTIPEIFGSESFYHKKAHGTSVSCNSLWRTLPQGNYQLLWLISTFFLFSSLQGAFQQLPEWRCGHPISSRLCPEPLDPPRSILTETWGDVATSTNGRHHLDGKRKRKSPGRTLVERICLPLSDHSRIHTPWTV